MDALFVDPKGLDWAPLMFLFAAYGYILFRASGMISDGAELLMLVLSPGLVGGFILPVMGAVPDGLIVLFSGIGPDAQQQLSVGVGTLAGSTIMLLTLPWAMCAVLGRVDLSADGGSALYKKGLTAAGSSSWGAFLTRSGIQTSGIVNPAARIMLGTALTYFVIQGPAWAQTQARTEDMSADTARAIGRNEASYSLAGFLLALVSFIAYSWYCVNSSMNEVAQAAAIREARKRAVASGLINLVQLMNLERAVDKEEGAPAAGKSVSMAPHLVKTLFDRYDTDGSGSLDSNEVCAMLAELQLHMPPSQVKALMGDIGGADHLVQLDEFVQLLQLCIDKGAEHKAEHHAKGHGAAALSARVENGEGGGSLQSAALLGGDEEEEEDDDEEEEDEAEGLTPAQIRRKAFGTLLLGVLIVTVFSDPMVNCLSEIASKSGVPPFYVAFIIAPLISNSSEIISSIAQARKKKKANIDVTYGQLLGAATMNVRWAPAAGRAARAFGAHLQALFLPHPLSSLFFFSRAEHLLPVHLPPARVRQGPRVGVLRRGARDPARGGRHRGAGADAKE